MNRIPLFPLNTVIFPGGLLPMKIFEARYLDLVSDCLKNNRVFGICLIKNGHEVGAPAEVHSVGTSVSIVDWEQRRDGLLGVLVHGDRRFRVLNSRVEANGLVTAEIEFLEREEEAAIPEEFRSMSDMLKRIMDELGTPYDRLAIHYDLAGEVGARITELLPLDLSVKQAILEMNDPLSRLFALRDAMREIKMAS
jgi:Lon protease-like protein